MSHCVVCGKPGDKHHIIHKAEGGLETPLNYLYLCPEHHRGFMGPHRNTDVDLSYKLDMQRNLEELFASKFYSAMEMVQYKLVKGERISSFFYFPNCPDKRICLAHR